MDDVNLIFQEYLAENAERHPLDFEPLLSRHPDLRDSLEKKIKAYEKVIGVMGDQPVEGKPSSMLGREIGGCKILRVIGQGGMGVVYLGRQEKLGRDVVVKVLRPFAVENEALKERFLRESRTIGRLNHKNIVPVYDVGEDSGSFLIIMKHLEGFPLSVLIQKLSGIDRAALKMTDIAVVLGREALNQFKSPTEFFCTLMIQVAEAVQYAHDNGVIHRDIKPSNIIIEPDGNPTLLDFGLSHDEIEQNLTLSGEFLGTPIYSAPELFNKGAIENNRLLDVYSLGVTLYEVMTGGLPYEGDSIYEIYSGIRNKEPIRPSARWSGIPRDLETIITTAISKAATFRYQAIDAFREDLECFLSYRPIQAKAPSSIQRLVYFARRRKRWIVVISIILSALSAGTYYFWRQIAAKNVELNQQRVKALLPVVLDSLNSNDYATAFKEVDKIYKSYPNNTSVAVWYYGLKAKIDHDFEGFKKAISVLEEKHPNDLYIRLAKIVIYHEEKDDEKEAKEKQFIFTNLNDEVMWRRLPIYLNSLGVSQPLVLEFLEVALRKYPQDADLNFIMSVFCEKYLKDDVCHKEYSRRAAGSSSRYVTVLADTYAKLPATNQELKGMINELEEMQKKSSADLKPNFFRSMATLYYRDGNCSVALEAINKAINLDPGKSDYLDEKENFDKKCGK